MTSASKDLIVNAALCAARGDFKNLIDGMLLRHPMISGISKDLKNKAHEFNFLRLHQK